MLANLLKRKFLVLGFTGPLRSGCTTAAKFFSSNPQATIDEYCAESEQALIETTYQQLEHRTASPEARLMAAKKLQHAGYQIRLRIDPVILYSTWKKDYIDLIEKIFIYVKPERITIGEYRPSQGLASHINTRFPASPLLKIHSGLVKEGAKLRYPDAHRLAMFKVIIDSIKKHDKRMKIALCKENVKIWKSLDMQINGLQCNCLG